MCSKFIRYSKGRKYNIIPDFPNFDAKDLIDIASNLLNRLLREHENIFNIYNNLFQARNLKYLN